MNPSSVMFVAWGFLFGGFFLSFLVWRKFFLKDPFKWSRIKTRNIWLRKRSYDSLLLESAKKAFSEGSFRIAETEFRSYLRLCPDSIAGHLGLAESLFEETIKGIKKDPLKRAEALQHFQWVLDYYHKTGCFREGTTLYQRLIGPYSSNEIGDRFLPMVNSQKS